MHGKRFKFMFLALTMAILLSIPLHSYSGTAEPSEEIEPPTVRIIDPPLCRCPGKVYDTDSVTVVWESNARTYPISHHEIRLSKRGEFDDWINVGMSTTHTFRDLEDESYGLEVRVFDSEGNVGEDHSGFVVDTFPDNMMTMVFISAMIFTLLFVFGLIYHKKWGTPPPMHEGVVREREKK